MGVMGWGLIIFQVFSGVSKVETRTLAASLIKIVKDCLINIIYHWLPAKDRERPLLLVQDSLSW